MIPSTPWVVNSTAYPFINLCTGNGATPVVGSQLMELFSFGQPGQIANNASWSVSVALVGSTPQTYTGCPTSTSYSTQIVNLFKFNVVYTALCTSQVSLPGCLTGTSQAGYDQGYYVLNLTLIMLTAPAPSGNGAQTFNAAYQVCQLLPGSQRSTWVSLTGFAPVYSTTPLTILPNPSIRTNPTGFTFDNWSTLRAHHRTPHCSMLLCAGSSTTDHSLTACPTYSLCLLPFLCRSRPQVLPTVLRVRLWLGHGPVQRCAGVRSGILFRQVRCTLTALAHTTGTHCHCTALCIVRCSLALCPRCAALSFGIIYQPSTPFLNNTVINLCTGNPTTGSPNPNTLVEEFPNGVGGVVSGWSITSSSQRWAQQSSFYFSYSAIGPVSTSGTTAWATVISGVLTVLNTATPSVYTIIGMTANRQTTNFASTVTTPLSLVGAMTAGNNNNLLYVNSAAWPQGMDNQGWGYTTNVSSLFPAAGSTAATLPANSYIQLVNGVVESSATQTVVYTNPTVSFTAYSTSAAAPTAPSLPTSPVVVATTPGSTSSTAGSTTPTATPTSSPASTVGTSTGTATTTTTTVYTSTSRSGLSKGAIAGIVIGTSIGFGLLCALLTAFIMLQTRRDDSRPMKHAQQQPSELSKVDNTEDSRRGEVELH